MSVVWITMEHNDFSDQLSTKLTLVPVPQCPNYIIGGPLCHGQNSSVHNMVSISGMLVQCTVS